MATKLNLFEPLGRNFNLYCELDGMLTKSFLSVGLEMQKINKDKTEAVDTAEVSEEDQQKSITRFSLSSLGDNTVHFFEVFQKLMCSGVCFLDEDLNSKKYPMKSGWLQMMKPKDLKELAVQYCGVYIAPKLD